jgi:hypothetical protein
MSTATVTSPAPRPAGRHITSTAIAAMPFGAVGLMQSAVAFGPVATAVGAGTVGLIGTRAVLRTKPARSAGTGRALGAGAGRGTGRRSLLGGTPGSRAPGRGRAGRLGSVLAGGRGRPASRHAAVGAGRGTGGKRPVPAGAGVRPGRPTASRSATVASRSGGRGTGRPGSGGTGKHGGTPRPSTTSGKSGTGGRGKAPSRLGRAARATGRAAGRLLGRVAGRPGSRRHNGASGGKGSGPKGRGGGGGTTTRRRGLIRRGLARLFRGSANPAKAAHKNSKRNARAKRRKLYRRLWRMFKRRMAGRPLRANDRWWQRWLLGRLLDRVGRGVAFGYRRGRNTSLFLAALASVTAAAWMQSAQRAGIRLLAVRTATVRALAVPFDGLGSALRRLLVAVGVGLRPWAYLPITQFTPPPALVEPAAAPRSTMADLSNTNIPTNLRPLIEAIREGGPLGGGEAPHALTVYQWHRDLQELMEAVAERVSADSSIAAETLPVSGDAHEITSSFGPATMGMAADIQEGTEAWVAANGSRIERLLDDEANKHLWDHSTRPDA